MMGPEQSASERAEKLIGATLDGRYRIEALVGAGGLGLVFRALHVALDRPVAVKVLHAEVDAVPEMRARFEREARVLASLAHPHIVHVTDYGVDGGMPYIVMELLEGITLADLLARGPLRPERATEIAKQILKALAYAHSRNVLHRDLKSANVFLQVLPGEDYHVKLLDFGLAKFLGGEGRSGDPTITAPGIVVGSPSYVAPEVLVGDAADRRSDLYSVGVLLFEMLSGRRPYLGDTPIDILRAHMHAPIPRVSMPHETARGRVLEGVVHRALAKMPPERYADAPAMLAALDQPVRRKPRRIPPAVWVAGGVIVVALFVNLVGLAIWLQRADGGRGVATEAAPVTPRPESGPSTAPGSGAPAASGLVPPGTSRVDAPPAGVAPTAGDAAEMAHDQGPPVGPLPTDPWVETPPESMARMLRALDRGQHLGRRDQALLYREIRDRPGDPRPLLLLAHGFTAAGWRDEAVERYRRAYAVDPDARGDPRMLVNLLKISMHSSQGAEAQAAVCEIYGAAALLDIDELIARYDDRPEGQRLLQLRRRIAPD